MDYIFWLIIGLVLMAIELVIPGGIAGLIGYCLFMWGVFIGLGGTDIAFICGARYHDCISRGIINLL